MLKSSVATSSLSHLIWVRLPATEFDNEARPNAFRKSVIERSSLSQFVGGDDTSDMLSWSLRRRIMQVLRKACAVMGPGQKSRIGRLGGGAAVGALIAGFSAPAMAQSVSGGNNNGQASSLAVGTGATTASVAGSSVAVGNGATVTSFSDGTAVGASARTTGGRGVAVGTRANAINNKSIAIGVDARALDASAGAIGEAGNIAIGDSSLAQTNGTDPFNASAATLVGNNGAATADGAVAFGEGATSSKYYSSALGSYATASGVGSVAVGGGSTATGTGGIAIGGATSTGSAAGLSGFASSSADNAIAIGASSSAAGVSAVAIGQSAATIGSRATSVGVLSAATGTSSIALGDTAKALVGNAVALGSGATAGAVGGFASGEVAVGATSKATGGNSIGIGFAANASASSSISLGANSKASGVTSIAAGSATTASGDSSVALGNAATASKTYSIAIGESASAGVADNTLAIGRNTSSTGLNGTAIGLNSRQSGGGIAAGNDVTASGLVGTSIGYRTDATGDFSTAIGTSAFAYGDRGVSIGVNTVTGVSGSKTTITKDVAIGDAAKATGGSSIALGDGAIASGVQSIAIGVGNNVSGANSGAIGDPNTITGSGSFALGNNNNIASNNAFVVGNGVTVAAGLNGSVTLGNASTVAASSPTASATIGATTFSGFAGATPAAGGVVSIGSAAAPRQLQNVAAGRVSATSTDAVSGSQLFSVSTVVDANKTAIDTLGNSLETVTGGGLVINPNGTIATAPSITAAGATFSTVTGAIQALNTANTTTNNGLATALGGGAAVAANGTVTAPSYSVGGTTYSDVGSALGALSSANLVQQTGGSAGQITVGAATGGTSVSVAGTSGNRKVTGVLAGSLAAASSDAVNGGQINTLGASIATNTGGGSSFNPATGIVTAPTVNVGGTAYSNLTSAIEAAGAGFNLTTAATGTGTASGTTVEGIVAGETVTVTAGDNIKLTQTANNVALALNPALTGITSLAITGGPTINGAGITLAAGDTFDAGGNKLTNVAPGSTAAGSTEVITGGQLNTGLASVATDLGGGASYNPVTGQLTAPGYPINGTTYNNVGAALAALAASSKYTSFNSALAAANATGTNASAVGPNAQAAGNNASAFGVNSDASGNGSTALGSGAVATGTNSVALGNNSQAGTANAGWAGTVFAGVTQTNNVSGNAVVSVSGGSTNRQITGVADGAVSATSTDAISGSQLFNTATALDAKATNLGAGLASSLGGGASVTTNGTVTNPSYSIAGGTQTNVGAALGALNTANNTANAGLAAAIGGGAAVAANGAVTAPTVPVNGTNYSNLTDAIAAAGAGFNFTTGASGSGTANGTSVAAIGAGETHKITAGNNIITTQSGNDVTVALNPALTGVTSLAITGGPTIDTTGITLAAGDKLDAGGNKITNLVAGSTVSGSTDGVNGGQLNTGLASVATGLGAGSTYDPATGTVTAPSYALGGSTYNNVGAALAAVDAGKVGLVQQVGGAPGSGNLTVGATTGGTVVDLTGTAGARNVTGLLAGSTSATSKDAVNGSQLNLASSSLATHLGGGATYNPATGVVTTPNYSIGGTTYNDVGSALGALTSGGAKQRFFNANSTGLDSTAVGFNSVAIGQAAVATNASDIALGNGSVSAAPHAGAFTLNGGTVAAIAPTSVLSIGTAGSERQIQNVAAGVVSATSTDAVNGSQLFATATAANNLGSSLATVTGGGLTLNPNGTIATPATITVGGVAYHDTTAAIQAGDTKADTLAGGLANALGGGAAVAPNGTVTAPGYALGGSTYSNVGAALAAVDAGKVGLVQQVGGAPGTGTLTVGATTGGTLVDLTGTGGTRTLTGVTAGSTAAASTDAVNGGQINTLGTSIAANTGGGSLYNPATGTVTAPTINAAGATYANTTAAIEALNAANATANTGVAAALGGGAAIAPNGTVTNPSYSVGAGTVNNVGAAIAALQSGAPVQYSTAGAPTTPNGLVPSQNLTLVGAAAGPVTLDNVAPGATTAASTQAINGSQLNKGLASVATDLGGGATYDPVTGKVTAPGYAINGTTYNNVGAALAIVDSALTGLTSGTAGLVQQIGGAPGSGQITVGASTGGTSLSVTGTAGDRTLSGVKAGALSATSTQAVNGSQVNTLASSIATNTGGGAAFDPVTGKVTAPVINVGGVAYNNVTAAVEAGDAKDNKANTGVAAALGGGASIAPDGTVSAPSYALGGSTFTDVGSALASLANGTTGLVQQVGGAPGSGQLTIGAATGGTSLSVAGTGGDRVVTGVKAGSTTATSTDAVNGGQLNTGLASVASNLGGGSVYDPATGKVTAPSYAIQGSTYSNVGAALGGVNSELTSLKNGGAGPLQFSSAATRTVANGGTPSQNLTLVGADPATKVTVSNLANGEIASTSSDAVNGSQLFALANALGTPVGPGGNVTPPSYNINGNTYGSVGGALGAINTAITGGGIKYFHANSTSADSAPVGADSVAIGPVSGAAGDRSVSIGLNANAGGISSIAIGTGNNVSGNRSGAIGDPSVITGNDSYVLGNNNNIAANNAFVVGNGVTIAAGNDGSVALGNGTTVSAPNAGAKSLNGGVIAATAPVSVVSVGSAGGERQVTNVAAGVVSATSTNAVNGSQLFAVGSALNKANTGIAAALGGGAAIAPDGTVTAPAYTVQGATVNNVGAALSSLNGAVTGLANGTSGIVQQTVGSPGAGQITVGGSTGGTTVSVAGTAGNRVISGVANGSLAANSKDAVNGGQLTAVQQAAAATSASIGNSVATSLGGGSTYDPATGLVSAPSYSVGGRTYGNVATALGASNSLAVQYVADSSGAPTNAVRLTGSGNGQPVSIGNVAAGAVAANSTEAVNGGQLFGVQQTANGALQRTGGSLSGNLGLGGNRITGLGAPIDATDAASKGYVDGIASQTNGQLATLTSGLNNAFKRIDKAGQGVAVAIALGGGFLADDKDFSLWGGWGNYDGYNAFGAQSYLRLSNDIYLNAGISFGLEENTVGTRVGFGIQF